MKNKYLIFFLLAKHLLIFFNCAVLNSNQQAEQNLLEALTKNYSKYIRPTEQVTINMTLSLKQIVSVDEKNQIMTTSNHISQEWVDARLEWNKSDYNGISVMMVPVKNIWIPDTIILNTADPDGYLRLSDYSLASVKSDGQVYLILPSALTRTRCDLNMKTFPFDTQTCSIIITSWSHGSDQVNYNLEDVSGINLDNYLDNTIWELLDSNISTQSNPNRVPYDVTDNIELIIQLNLKRKPLYYMINGVLPCLVLNLITILAFMFPYAQQITLSMTTFLTYSVYAVRLSNDLPTQSEFLPLITLYFIVSTFFTLLSMFWFFLCNFILVKGSMPGMILKFCEILRYRSISCNCLSKFSKTVPVTTIIIIQDVENDEEITSKEVLKENLDVISCQKCNNLLNCEKAENEEKEQAKTKKEFEINVSVLNYFALFCFTILLLTSLLCVWISI
jgi:hypothetical protein